MFVILDSWVERTQAKLNINAPVEEIPMMGTLAVVTGKLDFTKTDGYIQFMKMALCNISNAYREQNTKWQEFISKLCSTADRLRESNVVFTGSTSEDFHTYCKKLSCIMDDDVKVTSLEDIGIEIMTSDDLTPFIEKHISAGNVKGFYYKETENAMVGLMHDLIDELNHIKLEKGSRNYDISYFLRGKYHEQVFDAMNMIIQTAIYAINCSSTKDRKAHDFDIQHVENRLKCVEALIKRAEHLI